ncbi:uncharacterized protein LOC135389660 [Ornithodoros turicata]|uniref:uncharacterized protein LOC135389660 n=1 Tax=Ornithodoros turicata TaxID=34597 RepID=UPI00313A1CE8
MEVVTDEISTPGKSQDCQCDHMQELLKGKEELEKSRKRLTALEEEVKSLKNEVYRAEGETALYKDHLTKSALSSSSSVCSIETFKDKGEDMMFYTGLPSYEVFKALLEYVDPWTNMSSQTIETSTNVGRPSALSIENQFLLVLMKLRLGLFEKDLAHRFQMHQSTVSRLFSSWMNLLYVKLSALPLWQSREMIDKNMPEAFKEKYPNTRVVIDATEMRCEVPSSLVLQSDTYSNYKSVNTFKGLIGVSPDGFVTFVSALYTGSISDVELVKRSGFLEMPFNEGDSVMADKGFRIRDLLSPLGVGLNIPPFLSQGHLTTSEVAETQSIASLRIHVERSIRRVKSFYIFDRAIPISLGPLVNHIWTVCVLLTNFQYPLIRGASQELPDIE